RPGEGTRLAAEGRIARDGDLPIATMGGLKARGHPVGATGVYQLAEATLQLTGRAGAAQLPDPELAMVQNIGGTGAMVVTHILERAAGAASAARGRAHAEVAHAERRLGEPRADEGPHPPDVAAAPAQLAAGDLEVRRAREGGVDLAQPVLLGDH